MSDKVDQALDELYPPVVTYWGDRDMDKLQALVDNLKQSTIKPLLGEESEGIGDS